MGPDHDGRTLFQYAGHVPVQHLLHIGRWCEILRVRCIESRHGISECTALGRARGARRIAVRAGHAGRQSERQSARQPFPLHAFLLFRARVAQGTSPPGV